MKTDPPTHTLPPSAMRRLRVFFLARRRMMFALLCGFISYHLMPDTWRQATRLPQRAAGQPHTPPSPHPPGPSTA